MGDRLKIGVDKRSDNNVQFYIIYDGERLRNVSFLDTIDMGLELGLKVRELIKAGATGDRDTRYTVTLLGDDYALDFIDIVNASSNFVSVSRWIGVK